MTKDSLQKRINQDIEEHLNTYQVILEYARLFLDKDKQTRANYKWIKIAGKGFFSGTALSIILWIEDKAIPSISITFETYMLVLILLFVIFGVGGIVLAYWKRHQIACLIEKDEKKELARLMDNLHMFINLLILHLKTVAFGSKPSNDTLVNIKDELARALDKQLSEVNRISKILGPLDPDLDKKAREIATERLQPYIKYFYPYEQ